FSHRDISLILSFYCSSLFYIFFFFNHPATTEIYTLSLHDALPIYLQGYAKKAAKAAFFVPAALGGGVRRLDDGEEFLRIAALLADRKSTRLNSSHVKISYAVFCLKKKK